MTPDVYSGFCWKNEGNVTTGGECGNYKKEGDCFNREHIFPKSWFGGFSEGANAQTDLFELWASGKLRCAISDPYIVSYSITSMTDT